VVSTVVGDGGVIYSLTGEREEKKDEEKVGK